MTPEQEQFKDAKFGMFIHWSLFSLPTGHKNWACPEDAIRKFTADEFDARSWVDLAREAGARYITFTSKHHNGFCLFSTELTDFNSLNSPARRDFVELLADECHAQRMPLFLYYSLPDLHHPEFKPGQAGKWARYIRFYRGQIRELCTNYGQVAGFWLDPGPWHGRDYPYHVTETVDIIRDLQPHALVMGRDFYESEKSVPTLPCEMGWLNDQGEGDPRPMPIPGPNNWPFEVCDTVNNSWEYKESDRNFKGSSQLIRKLVSIAGLGGNYLLNQAPMGSGRVQPEQAERFREIGAWLKRNGESIYGTRPVAIAPPPWGFIVFKARRAYLHVTNWPGGSIELVGLGTRVESASLLHGEPVPHRRIRGRETIGLPESASDSIDTIIAVELDGKPPR